jgi:hypothetical protein
LGLNIFKRIKDAVSFDECAVSGLYLRDGRTLEGLAIGIM